MNKRITFWLFPDQIRKIKARCILEGRTASDIIREIFTKYLANTKSEDSSERLSSKKQKLFLVRERKAKIRARDSYICQVCGLPQTDELLCVHHIDYDENNNKEENLISVHRNCHKKIDGDKRYWKEYLTTKAISLSGSKGES